MAKQTARNNAFLRAHRPVWSTPAYQKLSEIVNQSGEQAGRDFLQTLLAPGVDLDNHVVKIMAVCAESAK
jgi:hypothetical protein